MSVCVLCGHAGRQVLLTATDRLYRSTRREFQIVACQGCGLMRLEPQPASGELKLYYPEDYWYAPHSGLTASLEEGYRRLVLRDHLRFVMRALAHSDAGGPLLDVGCGGGLFPRMLRERGRAALGLDSSAKAAAVAWKTQGVPVICGDLAHAPLAPASCAAITMFHVLEHVSGPRAYLAAARALLQPDGRLIVQVPNAACWQFRLLGRRWNGLDVPRHLTDFRERDLQMLLESAGFEVVRRKHFSWRDNPAGLAISLWPGLDPMARRVRGVREGSFLKLLKDLAHLALLAAAVPFTWLEAAAGAGSTIMVEARKKP